ncbi:MAG: phosphatidylserine decarboxylase [Alphaproteobacteria bacterium]|nr:phosphatidylserine decarboxylase [Alphaproteobacteria bacterium]MDE2500712.1 phosphatidylserine decarboxylase [Alphaproteobacteria bacterium]
MRIPIHRAGWPFIGIFVAANLLLFFLSSWVGWAFVLPTLWCIAFFRDPERSTPSGDGLVISPADGRLLPIAHAAPPLELGMGSEPRVRLSIFMNVFNVHVNRVPVDGTVVALSYRKGRFFNAAFDKASEHNERMSIRIHHGHPGDAGDLAVVQIAGLIARRIKCDLGQGQQVRQGERFGIIRFGSRLDVYLPRGAQVLAAPGQHVKAGETVLAKLQ